MKTYRSGDVHALINREAEQTRLANERLAKELSVSAQTLSRARSGEQGDLGWKKIVGILNYFGYEVVIRRQRK